MATVYCNVCVEFDVSDELAQDYEQMFQWTVYELSVHVDNVDRLDYWVDDLDIMLECDRS